MFLCALCVCIQPPEHPGLCSWWRLHNIFEGPGFLFPVLTLEFPRVWNLRTRNLIRVICLYRAKLTGGPWEAVQNAVMGSRMSKLNEANGFLSCPHKTRTARAPQILLGSQKTAQKEGAVRVWYAILLICAPEFFTRWG